MPRVPSRSSKPATQSVTLGGILTCAVGIGIGIAGRNGLDLSGYETEIAYLLQGAGLLLGVYGRVRPTDRQDRITARS